MVNHLRSLILNRRGMPDEDGEELIESSFNPRSMTQAQEAVRAAIFPGEFPHPYQNFIATILARIIRDSPLLSLMDKLDSRHLMSEPSSRGFESQLTVDRIANAASVVVTGRYHPRPGHGIFSRGWKLQYSDPSHLLIQDLQTDATSIVPVAFINNSSESIHLEPESTLRVRLSNVSAVPAGLYAVVSAQEPMEYDLFTLEERFRNSGPIRNLFLQVPNQAVAAECRSGFDHHNRSDWAIASVLTAYAYSFEEAG